jgi:hypothetical protein
MFRLTLSESVSKTLSSQFTQQTPQMQRIYRWGSMWGILIHDEWTVEKRTPVDDLSCNDRVVERIERMDMLPPIELDDVWEEEILRLQKSDVNLTYDGNLISVLGTADSLRKWCAASNLECPAFATNAAAPRLSEAKPLNRPPYRDRNRGRKL